MLTKEEVLKRVKEEQIEFIDLQFTDILGVMKSVSITAEQLPKALNNEIMFDGSSIDGFVRIEESDMYLRPDLSTFMLLPWTEYPREARIICDIQNEDGSLFEGCPRNKLKQLVQQAKERGYVFNVGPECEFFLFHTNDRGEPSLETHDNAGYFDMAPIDLGGNARKDMVMTLKSLGFEIEASHHEVAPGQHEIDFKYADALTTADNIMTFKMVVRIIAQRHGLHATFMPKPTFGVSGSGMHVNMSLESLEGKNLFYLKEDPNRLSPLAYQFMAGLMQHARAFTAITNPTVNSYKRLVPGYEAPVLITWSSGNRSPLIRIPSKRETSTRLELRSPDPTANPYLALCAILSAGLDGIDGQLSPEEEVNGNVYDLSEQEIEERAIRRLPLNLHEAVYCLKESKLMKEAIGAHIYEKLINAQLYEWNSYSNHVSRWEMKRYLKKF